MAENSECHCEENSQSVISTSYFAEAAKGFDNDGHLPIYYVCKWGASLDLLDILVFAYPDSIGVKDGNGRLPTAHSNIVLMNTCTFCTRLNVEKGDGNVPRNQAFPLKTEDSIDIIMLYPGSSLIFDKKGRTTILHFISSNLHLRKIKGA